MFNEEVIGCWKITEKSGDELITRWVDNDGIIVKTERTKVESNAK